MKTKQQKRIEAIERLERPVQVDRCSREYADEIQKRRRAEARRLREKFGFAEGVRSAGR